MLWCADYPPGQAPYDNPFNNLLKTPENTGSESRLRLSALARLRTCLNGARVLITRQGVIRLRGFPRLEYLQSNRNEKWTPSFTSPL